MLAGDTVTELDGTSLQGLTLDQVIDKMRGPTGSKAELTISRKNQDRPIRMTITREPIRLRALLRVQTQGGALVVEATGGRQVFEFHQAKPLALVPLSDAESRAGPVPHARRLHQECNRQSLGCGAQPRALGTKGREDREGCDLSLTA